MKRLSHAALLLTITAVALFAEPNSSIQFYDEDGSTETAQMGWDGENEKFYIETPGSNTPLEMKDGDLTVPGEVTADKFNGDGGGLKNLPASELGAAGGDLTGSYSNLSINREAVTSEKINGEAVTSSKLAKDAVTTVKIDDDAVTSSKIAEDAVTTSAIDNKAVTTSKLDDNAVTSSKIDNGTIQEVDLNSSLGSKINGKMDKSGGTFTGPVKIENHSSHGGTDLVVRKTDGWAAVNFQGNNPHSTGNNVFFTAGGTKDEYAHFHFFASSDFDLQDRDMKAKLSVNSSGVENWGHRITLYHTGSNGVVEVPFGNIILDPADGIVRVDGTLSETSDGRLKHSVQAIDDPIDKVCKMRGVRYVRTGAEKREIGFIAQEVETILPEVVFTGEDGYKSVAYQNITALLVEAMKEQQKKIEQLTKTIELLEARTRFLNEQPTH